MDKLAAVRTAGTAAPNVELTHEDILHKLSAWDAAYGIEVAEAKHDAVAITFATLPDDLAAFAREVYAFCPDIIDQGFGVLDEMIEHFEEMGRPLPADTQKLLEGVDLSREDFGEVLLARHFEQTKTLALWWD